MLRKLIYRHEGKPAFQLTLLKNEEKGNYYIESNLPIILIEEIKSVINRHKNEGIEYNPGNFESFAQEIADAIYQSNKASAFYFNDIFVGTENQLDTYRVVELWNAHDSILALELKYVTHRTHPVICFYLKMVANMGLLELNQFISYSEIPREEFEKRIQNNTQQENYIEQYSSCTRFIKVLSDIDQRPSFIGALNVKGDVLVAYII